MIVCFPKGDIMANVNMREYVARRIRELRVAYGKRGLSQEELAQMVGVSTNTISRWETGTYEPTLNDLELLSRKLGVRMFDLFPKLVHETSKDQTVDALLRAANELDQSDIDELRRYAEFRRARSIYKRKRK
jgi:transcriptional regulator with XRE-family HTH domain